MGHAAHESGGGSQLVIVDVESTEADLKEGIALGRYAYGFGSVCAGNAIDGHIERGGDHVPAPMVGVVS